MSPSKAQPIAILITTLLVGSYFAGYLLLRARCTPLTPEFVVVPTSTPSQPDALITFYKPLFHAEQRLTGRQFTLITWGLTPF
jgi:hypothetical protein